MRPHQYRLWRAVNPFGQAVQVTALGKHPIDLLKLVPAPLSTVTHRLHMLPPIYGCMGFPIRKLRDLCEDSGGRL